MAADVDLAKITADTRPVPQLGLSEVALALSHIAMVDPPQPAPKVAIDPVGDFDDRPADRVLDPDTIRHMNNRLI